MITDTIVAQATPPGRGGIAIVRVSGPLVKKMMLDLWGEVLAPRQAVYLPFKEVSGEVIDEGIALYFPNPHSFTGEDVLELQGHGGPVVVDLLLQRLINLGARLARPGEFSERAFLNGKIDLAQAEAIADLIDASSRQAARLAVRSLQGAFSNEIQAINEKVIRVRMFIEAAIDFSEEEIDFLSMEKISTELENILDELTAIQQKAKHGSLLREGITAVIAGEPNVGKSSLLNRLSGKELAIVTDIPGTTRDVLRDYILIDGMPIHIIDTAGLRDSEDRVEQEGIKRAYHEIEKADLVLYVLDASKSASIEGLPDIIASRPVIFIHNKIDLIQSQPSIKNENENATIALSAKTGDGIALLKKHIKSLVGFTDTTEGIFLARRRHLDVLARAFALVQASITQMKVFRSCELAAEDLRLAQLALSEITGEFTPDDLLGRIFSNFCIGK
ncbi:tRNA uridine-5-carboxymethylaminomethyl(34) synthesis GTPase MnmE [Aquicella lusitana]|uniref:tRNA uridine-5-carboxymethylaminomethyl(34) synthesis GTPase MnmE n=1 Tax=Aquicella lusitana TaxID=254246 RepID=UPI001475A3C0|nr:tRNA uridine-5-carboxymethylaminomethyl(34) synthesis GTPase MnmE [Aquicella lusitana]